MSGKYESETGGALALEEDGPQLRISQMSFLIGSLLAGVAMGGILLVTLFSYIPTDVQRLGILFEALQSGTHPPEIVVFGNSVVMSGVDALALSDELPDQPTIWNCSSTGQTLTEAFLLTQSVPAISRTRIYTIPVRAGATMDPLHAQKFNTLFMNGYRPDVSTVSTLQRIYGADLSAMLTRSTLSQVFASRWAFRQYIDRQVRMVLRPDLALEKATRDLFHPQSYKHAIDAKITARFIQRDNEDFDEKGIALADGTTALATSIATDAGRAGRRTFFLFPPIHPALLAKHGAAMEDVLRTFENDMRGLPDTAFIDATRLLGPTDFIDDKHPTNDGAIILSRFIAKRLIEIEDE